MLSPSRPTPSRPLQVQPSIDRPRRPAEDPDQHPPPTWEVGEADVRVESVHDVVRAPAPLMPQEAAGRGCSTWRSGRNPAGRSGRGCPSRRSDAAASDRTTPGQPWLQRTRRCAVEVPPPRCSRTARPSRILAPRGGRGSRAAPCSPPRSWLRRRGRRLQRSLVPSSSSATTPAGTNTVSMSGCSRKRVATHVSITSSGAVRSRGADSTAVPNRARMSAQTASRSRWSRAARTSGTPREASAADRARPTPALAPITTPRPTGGQVLPHRSPSLRRRGVSTRRSGSVSAMASANAS